MLVEFITEIDKKEQSMNILGLGSSNTENSITIFVLTHKRMTWHIHTTSVILYQPDAKSRV